MTFEIGDFLRKIYDAFFHRPMNFSFIDDYVCGSARIMSKQDVEWLNEKGVRAVISLTEDPIPAKWLEPRIEYLHVPVINHKAPTQEQLETCLDFISSNVKRQNKTLIHCAAGKGRTGTVIAAYICDRDNISAESAIDRTRLERPGSVEKDQESGQENAVIEFQKVLYKRRNASA